LAVAGLVWIIFIIIVALSADLWVPRAFGDPIHIDTTIVAQRSLLAPSAAHPFGTDKLGRDILSRVVYGARVSLLVGIVAVAIMVILGLIAGAIAAYYGGLWDAIIMRTADVFFAFPYVLFAVALIAVLGKGLQNVFIAIGVLGWPTIARVFRSSILSVKENEYVDAARAMGASTRRIVFRHIMPNSMAPIIVYATMSVGVAILTEAALSFLGMGVQPPSPSWGGMLSESRSYLFTAPWLMLYPGIAILTTVLGFVLLGDGLRDALDVKLKE
jgi:peptide/nickel transport system permease protein